MKKNLFGIVFSIVCCSFFLTSCGGDDASDRTTGIDQKTDLVDVEIPNLPAEKLIGDFDPNEIPIRISIMEQILDFEIDSTRTRYAYYDLDDEGQFQLHEWDITGEDDERIWSPPDAQFGSPDFEYEIFQYDTTGKLARIIRRTVSPKAGTIATTAVVLYEYNTLGEKIASYTYYYDEYEWDYFLWYINLFHNEKAVSVTYFDRVTHKRAEIKINGKDTHLAAIKIQCDEDGYPESYCTYEYDKDENVVKTMYFDLEEQLLGYTLYEYDSTGNVTTVTECNASEDG